MWHQNWTESFVQEKTALYSPAMTGVLSGGFVWEFFKLEEDEQTTKRAARELGYGIVRINTNGRSVRTTKEFRTLKERFNVVTTPMHGSHEKKSESAIEVGGTDGHDRGNDILDTEKALISWRGSFPQISSQWYSGSESMPSLIDWRSLESRVLDDGDQEWVIMKRMSELLLHTERDGIEQSLNGAELLFVST